MFPVAQVNVTRCSGWLQTGKPQLKGTRGNLLLPICFLYKVCCRHFSWSVHALSTVRSLFHYSGNNGVNTILTIYDATLTIWHLEISRLMKTFYFCAAHPIKSERIVVVGVVGLLVMTQERADSPLQWSTRWNCSSVPPRWSASPQASWSSWCTRSVRTSDYETNLPWKSSGNEPHTHNCNNNSRYYCFYCNFDQLWLF